MSSVKSIQQNYQPKANLKKSNLSNNPSFRGGLPSAAEDTIIAEVTEHVTKNLTSNPIKRAVNYFSNLFNKKDGEIQTQLINAAFTGTLAPTMIAFNPFSKQDEKTKKYTALRQPVSAVIAMTGGLGMTILTNSYMNKLCSEGYIPYIDGRLAPTKDYLKAKFKKQTEIKNLDDYVKAQHKEIQEFFTHLISTDPKRIRFEKDGNISILDEAGNIKTILDKDNKPIHTLSKKISNINSEKQLQEYLKEKNLHERTFGDFMKEHYNLDIYSDGPLKGKIQASSISEKYSKINALEFLKASGLIGDATKEETGRTVDAPGFKKATSKARQRKGADGFRDGFKKDLDVFKDGGSDDSFEALVKHISRMIQDEVGADDYKKSKMTLDQLLERFGKIKLDGAETVEEIAEARMKSLNELIKTPMKDVLDDLAQKLKNCELDGFKQNASVTDFAKNLIANKAALVGKNFPNFNKYAGIFFNLFMVAITCTALNWAFPRFVEKFFPSLAKPDHPAQPETEKGGNK